MQQVKTFIIASLVFIAGAFMSCNQSGQQTTETTTTNDSTATQAPPVEKKTVVMVVSHHVKDYAAWRPFFDKDEANRQAAKMNVLGVYQDASDPNYVSISMSVQDVEAAKQFASSDVLKQVMQQAGVADQPEVKFYEFEYDNDAAANNSDNRAFVIAKVQDYQTWKTVFDSRDSIRKAAGISTVIVAKNLENPNQVAVGLAAADMQTLQNFMQSPDVKEAMQKSGVVGPPIVQYAKKAPASTM